MKFSIITCSYNCLEGLKAARAQVLAQQGVEIEHIIVDGGSTDGTREWLEACGVPSAECGINAHSHSPPAPLPNSALRTPHSALKWISEPDKGLYDALNKGLHLATGDIIGVLHCDDVWEHDHVLANVAEIFSESRVYAASQRTVHGPGSSAQRSACPTAHTESMDTAEGTASAKAFAMNPSEDGTLKEFDAVYADLYYVEAGDISRVRRVWRSGSYHPRKFYHGWMPPHTALFVRRVAALRVGDYLLDHGSAADYEWMLRAALVNKLQMVHLPEVILRMRIGGASNQSVQRRLEAHRFDQLAWERNHLKPYPWTLKLKPLRKLPQWLHALGRKRG